MNPGSKKVFGTQYDAPNSLTKKEYYTLMMMQAIVSHQGAAVRGLYDEVDTVEKAAKYANALLILIENEENNDKTK